MAKDDGGKLLARGAPESAAMLANVKRAMAITAKLNRLTFEDQAEVRALSSKLIGKPVDDSFFLIPPSTRRAASTSGSGAMSSSIRTAPSMTSAGSTSPTM